MGTRRLTIALYGLGCGGGGALAAERALARVPGVVHAYVNPATEMAYIAYDTERSDLSQITLAVEKVGLRAGEPRDR